MKYAKVAISIDEELLDRLDCLVKAHKFSSRSQAFQIAVKEKISRLSKTQLATECAKLDKNFERSLAEEGIPKEFEQWPEY